MPIAFGAADVTVADPTAYPKMSASSVQMPTEIPSKHP